MTARDQAPGSIANGLLPAGRTARALGCASEIARSSWQTIALVALAGLLLGLLAEASCPTRRGAHFVVFVDPAGSQANTASDTISLAREAARLESVAASDPERISITLDAVRSTIDVEARAETSDVAIQRLQRVLALYSTDHGGIRPMVAPASDAILDTLRSRVTSLEEKLEIASARAQATAEDIRNIEDALDAARKALHQALIEAVAGRGQAAKRATPVSIVTPPSEIPVSAFRSVLLPALGALSGLLVGLIAAMCTALRDRSIRGLGGLSSAADFAAVLAIPERPFGFAFGRRAPLPDNSTAVHPDFAFAHQVMTNLDREATRAYRQAVLRVLARIRTRQKPGRPHVVMLTSPRLACGNSTIVACLAEGAAAQGDRVLFIDANVRDPAMSWRADVETEGTLQDGDFGRASLEATVLHHADIGFSILPLAGRRIPGSDLGARRQLISGLTGLIQDFDLVLIDAGGALEDEASVALMPIADQTWITVRHAATTASDAHATLGLLVSAPLIAGAILTFAPDL